MAPLLAIGGIASAGGALGQMFGGMGQSNRGWSMAKALRRPDRKVSKAARDRVKIANMRLGKTLPTATALNQVRGNLATTLEAQRQSAQSTGDLLNAASKAGFAVNRATQDLNIAEADRQDRAYGQLDSALQGMAQEEQQRYRDLLELYKMDMASASGQIGAGAKNALGGVESLGNLFSSFGALAGTK